MSVHAVFFLLLSVLCRVREQKTTFLHRIHIRVCLLLPKTVMPRAWGGPNKHVRIFGRVSGFDVCAHVSRCEYIFTERVSCMADFSVRFRERARAHRMISMPSVRRSRITCISAAGICGLSTWRVRSGARVRNAHSR